MSALAQFRMKRGLSQQQVADAVGLSSRGQVSDIERGHERASADIAIAIDRLTAGEVPVRELRPDLHDVRVIRADEAGAGA